MKARSIVKQHGPSRIAEAHEGEANCPHYELCKPEGRFGKRSWDRT